jgi:hypothetical protein
MGDWSPVRDRLDVMVFEHPLGDLDAVASALHDFEIVCATRERTPFPRAPFERPGRGTTGPRHPL